jgi:hypothetical protein
MSSGDADGQVRCRKHRLALRNDSDHDGQGACREVTRGVAMRQSRRLYGEIERRFQVRVHEPERSNPHQTATALAVVARRRPEWALFA